MAAFMTCLIGAALAAFGGRWWTLASALHKNGARSALPMIAGSAIAAGTVAALGGAWIGTQVRGPGMLLFLALAILFAGASALWPGRGVQAGDAAAARGPLPALILLLAAQLGDSAPFLILAVAAWSREPALAAVGGSAGMLGAVLLGAFLPARLGRFRAGVAVLLLGTGAWLAVSALGLV